MKKIGKYDFDLVNAAFKWAQQNFDVKKLRGKDLPLIIDLYLMYGRK